MTGQTAALHKAPWPKDPQGRFFTKNFMPAGRLHFLGHAMTDGKGPVKIVLGLLPAKIGKDRALGEFLDIGAAF